MSNLRNLLVFVLAIATSFVYICNAIPQIESQQVAEGEEIGETPAELIAAGKRIFTSDRAQCLTCHSLGEDPKARCPNMELLGQRAATRKSGVSAGAYLVESVYNPNAFVVPGYPKNQMTPVNKPPIALSHDEILAVIAFLNSQGGETDDGFVQQVRQAQEPWRKGLLKPEQGTQDAKIAILPGNVEEGRKVFEMEKSVCSKCHRVGTQGGDVGPELTAIGASQGAEYILQSILNPSAVIVKGYGETTVMVDQQNRIQGVPVQWIPNKEHPQRLRLGILEGGELKERIVDLAEVFSVGDTVVGYQTEDDFAMISGEYVSGDEKTGVTLRVLQDGSWVERRIEADVIEAVRHPISPMPTNFADLMKPQEMFDLIAFLLAQKGKK